MAQMFPDMPIFQTCTYRTVLPAVIMPIASYLTETSVSYVSGTPRSKVTPAGQPPAPPNPPPPAASPAKSNPTPVQTPVQTPAPVQIPAPTQTPAPANSQS